MLLRHGHASMAGARPIEELERLARFRPRGVSRFSGRPVLRSNGRLGVETDGAGLDGTGDCFDRKRACGAGPCFSQVCLEPNVAMGDKDRSGAS